MKNIDKLSNKTKVDLDEFERQELNNLEKQSIKNTIKTKKQKRVWKKVVGTVVAASLAVGLFFQTGTGQEVYAAAKEFLLDKYNIVFTGHDEEMDLTELVDKTGIVKEFVDYDIELRYAIRDRDRGFYKLLIHYKKDIDYENGRLRLSNNENDDDITYDDDFEFGLNIDGKKIEMESGSSYPQLIDKENNIFQFELEEKYKENLSELIKKDSKIEFNITGFAFEFDNKDILVEDKISFDITNTFKDMAYLNKEYEVVGNKKFKDEKTGIEVEVGDIRLNPFTQTFELNYKNDKNNMLSQGESELQLFGITNGGKEIGITGHASARNDKKGNIEYDYSYMKDQSPSNGLGLEEAIKQATENEELKGKIKVNTDMFKNSKKTTANFDDILNAKEIKFKIVFEEQRSLFNPDKPFEIGDELSELVEIRDVGEFTIKLK